MKVYQVITKQTSHVYGTWSEAKAWLLKAKKMGLQAKIVELTVT